jgi:hypothetical protein
VDTQGKEDSLKWTHGKAVRPPEMDAPADREPLKMDKGFTLPHMVKSNKTAIRRKAYVESAAKQTIYLRGGRATGIEPIYISSECLSDFVYIGIQESVFSPL